MQNIRTVGIISKPKIAQAPEIVTGLLAWLDKRGVRYRCDQLTAEYAGISEFFDRAKMHEGIDLLIVLGGDGTLLSVARIFAATGTPILGVNLGSLGFLTEVRLADLYATLEGWCGGRHEVDARAMLHAELWREGALSCSFEALNEVVVSKGDIARMGDFAVELDGKNVARFRADGVIVSTPTGSTAYTLAANGPILTPNVDAMVVTPICPHLLTLRPIVVRGDARLAVRVEGIANQAALTVDGQKAVELLLGDEIRCRKSAHTVNLVRMSEGGFFEALRSKLSWGER